MSDNILAPGVIFSDTKIRVKPDGSFSKLTKKIQQI